MEPFRTHSGIVAPLDRADVDTDQIIPKQFLKRVERSGYGQFLFWDWRFDEHGSPRPDFVLNQDGYRGATVLVTRRNFGCGSSREHAAWALQDFGFRVILAPSFADIFRENADQNGIAALTLTEQEIDSLIEKSRADETYRLTVDLQAGTVTDDRGPVASFELDEFRRTCLLEGLDRIGLTLRHEEQIRAYEERRWPGLP